MDTERLCNVVPDAIVAISADLLLARDVMEELAED